MINVVIPMAGLGSRFSSAGYVDPKPFIDVLGKPMIEQVVSNLATSHHSRYILIVQRAHLSRYRHCLTSLMTTRDVELVEVDYLPQGSAASVFAARHLINNNDELVIANSDQLVDFNLDSFISDARCKLCSGSILVFKDLNLDPKWSFAETDEFGFVRRVAEKEVISELATVGIYYFRSGNYFIDSFEAMRSSRDLINNEYYTCPVYNYLIRDGHRVSTFEISASAMHGLGTPEDLRKYLSSYSFNV